MSHNNILLESGTNELEIVEFYIDELDEDGTPYTGYYGVNVAKVLEIIRQPQTTEMPEAKHPCLLGAFNLRSKIVPLIDLSIWLGKSQVPSENKKVIVTEFNHVINSFLVSGVTRIHRLSWEQIEPPDPNLSKFSEGSITGVVKFEDRIVLILDMERITADLNPKLSIRVEEVAPVEPIKSVDHTPRVLFADDSSMIRKTMDQGLTKAGFLVETATDGKVAWERLLAVKAKAAQEEKPVTDFFDILISDIEMPAMDGHNLTKRVKDDPVLKALPVILFSSLITEALRHKGEAVGADDQISKPDIKTLAERARNLIDQYRTQG